jgi:uncharacterized protein (TIGR03084 family)
VTRVEEVLSALAEQQAELDGLLAGLDDASWARPTPCETWDIADVVLHLAQTNEFAAASARHELPAGGFGVGQADTEGKVDELAEFQVAQDRGNGAAAVRERWEASVRDLNAALSACDPSDRVNWIVGQMAARTLATTRIAETWIHTGDVAVALGHTIKATPRLWHIARLAWRTLPYAFERAGRELSGPVAVELDAPDGGTWSFTPDAPAATQVRGDALEFCLIAGRRLDPADSGLHADGPDAAAVLELVRTYA